MHFFARYLHRSRDTARSIKVDTSQTGRGDNCFRWSRSVEHERETLGEVSVVGTSRGGGGGSCSQGVYDGLDAVVNGTTDRR